MVNKTHPGDEVLILPDRPIKVDRRCPHCHQHHYCLSTLRANQPRGAIRISCPNCGHEWTGRVTERDR